MLTRCQVDIAIHVTMYVILQAHHSESCSGYPVKCKFCELDVPRHCVSVDVLGLSSRVSMHESDIAILFVQ